jgi:hypothetical protein
MSEHGNELSRRSVLKHSALATGSVILGGVAASGTAAAGIGDGRVGHYNLNNLHLNKDTDEKIKNFVHDASPEKNHGTNNGAEVVKDGAVGKAFEFDGEDDYVNVPLDDDIFADNAATLATWVKPDTVDASQDYVSRIFAFSSTSDSQSRGQIKLGINANGKLQVAGIDEDGEVRVSNADGQPLSEGVWTHLAGVFDGSSADIFVDGEPVALSSQDEWNGLINNSETPLRIGARGDDTFHANATIDEVRVYDRALTDAEVTELYEMKD